MKNIRIKKTRGLFFSGMIAFSLMFAGCSDCVECSDCNVMGIQLEGATDHFEGKWCESDFNSKAEWKQFQKQANNMCECE